jgi:hypothetical protein
MNQQPSIMPSSIPQERVSLSTRRAQWKNVRITECYNATQQGLGGLLAKKRDELLESDAFWTLDD